MNIGRVIKSIAILRDIPLADLAEAVEMSQSSFSRYMNGERSFDPNELAVIAGKLGMKPSDIFLIAEAEADRLASTIATCGAAA